MSRVVATTLLVVLLSGANVAKSLMFHSKAVTKQWDTWVFVENGTFYAYYLVTEVSYGEGFGVATSANGQHWEDHGYVWKGPSWWNPPNGTAKYWEGSSAVWRAADFNKTGRYLINYSQMNTKCGCQNITFAESYDLIHWTNGLERNQSNVFPWFNIDPAHYKVEGGRWDTIYSIPVPGEGMENVRDGYPRYGYWTASPDPATAGTFGMGITEDGFTWKALPAPVMLPEAIGAELGAVEFVREGVYVAMLGYGWPRTMLAYTAKSPVGPFTRNAKNVNFLNGSCYYSRFFRGPAPGRELLVTHQTWDNKGTHFSYVSPFKTVEVDDEGTFRLTWWPANENLKGEPLPLSGTFNVSQGFVVEADFTIPASADPSRWPGFLIDSAQKPLFVGVDHTGVCNVGVFISQKPDASGFIRRPGAFPRGGDIHVANMSVPAAEAWCKTTTACAGFTTNTAEPGSRSVYFKGALIQPNSDKDWTSWAKAGSNGFLSVQGRWGRDLTFRPGQVVKARLLFRRSMLEMYLDDYLFPVFAMAADAVGTFGVSNASVVTGARAWRMSLPADSDPGDSVISDPQSKKRDTRGLAAPENHVM